MNRWTSLLLVLLAISASPAADGQTYKVLLSFTGTGGAYPGQGPVGSLTLSGSTLYGMTNPVVPSSRLWRPKDVRCCAIVI